MSLALSLRTSVSSLAQSLRRCGLKVPEFQLLPADASVRSFVRLLLPSGRTLVAMVYPSGLESQALRHAQVFLWAAGQDLPVPRMRALTHGVLVVDDLGATDLRSYLCKHAAASSWVLLVLQSFQRSSLAAPNPPFDAHLFLREMEQFLDAVELASDKQPAAFFCRALAEALASHPYRLCHRDFHLDNLMVVGERVMAVDFQDLRAGPDTYDLVSLLRERGGSSLFPPHFAQVAAETLGLLFGWEHRYWQCAAQRGLKALGSFLRLAKQGRDSYLRWVPEVATNTLQALEHLRAPEDLVTAVSRLQQVSAV